MNGGVKGVKEVITQWVRKKPYLRRAAALAASSEASCHRGDERTAAAAPGGIRSVPLLLPPRLHASAAVTAAGGKIRSDNAVKL